MNRSPLNKQTTLGHMGRGNSSDVYDLRISKPKGRTILVTITPTSSGSITLPMVGGEGSLIVGFLWELIPYAIRYRKDLTSEESPFRMTIDGLEVSEWWKSKKNQVPVDMHNRWWEVWNSESADVKADYYAKSKAQKAAEQAIWLKKIKEENLPPLAEISIDHIFAKIPVWNYIQSVRLVSQTGVSEEEDSEAAFANPVTGVYEVIMTSEKWLRGIALPASNGTTSYDQPPPPLHAWSRELHSLGYVPKAFTLRVIVMLMMRLPRHAPNPISIIPLDVFYLIVAQLFRLSYEEKEVPQWEIKYQKARRAHALKLKRAAAADVSSPTAAKKGKQ